MPPEAAEAPPPSPLPAPPLVRRLLGGFWGLLFLALLVVSAWQTGFSVGDLVTGTGDFFAFFRKLAPDWSYLPEIWAPLLETVQIAYLGTLFGTLLALPLIFLASYNTTTDPVTMWLARGLLTVLRSVPDLLYAAILAPILAIGPLPGVVALTIFSLAVLAKLSSETVEAIDPGPLEALRATGAGRNRTILYGVVPQISATVTSFVLYVFEINIRASVVIGLVGAGGIGETLLARLNFFAYGDVSLIILVIFALVLLIDAVSVYARTRLI